MAKDFKGIPAGKVKSTIAEATQENTETQEVQKTRKERKTYAAQEAAEFMQNLRTTGHKGVKLPRINLAFTPEVYDYVKTMSKAAGLTYTEFINRILLDHKEKHSEVYQQAINIRNSI